MSDKPDGNSTNKEFLEYLVEANKKQVDFNERQLKDITAIKKCLLGDEYHEEGLVQKVAENKEDINTVKKRSNFVGGVVGVITVAATTVVNYFIFGSNK